MKFPETLDSLNYRARVWADALLVSEAQRQLEMMCEALNPYDKRAIVEKLDQPRPVDGYPYAAPYTWVARLDKWIGFAHSEAGAWAEMLRVILDGCYFPRVRSRPAAQIHPRED